VRLSSINPVLPTFRARHPNVKVEVDIEDRFVDIVAEGYDAGRRLSEAIERDMVQGRLTDAFRFVVVGALERHGTPEKPQEDAMREEEQRPRGQMRWQMSTALGAAGSMEQWTGRPPSAAKASAHATPSGRKAAAAPRD
jgi:DNA-binding transcriptional LysR family regulator